MCGEVVGTVNSELLEKIRELATSEDWRAREEAAAMIKKLNDSHFEEYLQVWRRWISDSNPSVRLAAAASLVNLLRRHPELRREVLSWQGCERAKEVVRRYVNLEER